jgi:ELWxxDGT repeat protein
MPSLRRPLVLSAALLPLLSGCPDSHCEEPAVTPPSSSAHLLHDSAVRAGQPDHPLLVGQTLFFTAFEPSTGRELWKRDLGTGRLERVKDIHPGTQGSDPRPLMSTNGTLLFTASDGRTGIDLWRSDGTETGTVRVKDLCPGAVEPMPRAFADLNGTLFFQGGDCADPKLHALWKSDGTEAGTVMVRGGFGQDSYNRTPALFTVWKGALYFAAVDAAQPSNTGLWKSDGTTEGTAFLTGGLPWVFGELGETLYFLGGSSARLGRTDGTREGTTWLKSLEAEHFLWSATGIVTLDGALFFGIGDYHGTGALWRSDGTTEGTVKVVPERIGLLHSLGRGLVFTRSTPEGVGLWSSNGTAEGTAPLASIPNGLSYDQRPLVVGGALYFAADDGMTGRELWRTDGTVAGTARVKDLRPGPSGSNVRWLLPSGGETFVFFAEQAAHTSLWRSDGTEAGTLPVEHLGPLQQGARDDRLVDVNGTLFFASIDGDSGSELWRTDGTAEGTVRVKDLHPGLGSSSPAPRLATDTLVFFTADDGTTGRELWRSDGTEAGTFLLKDIAPGTECPQPLLHTIVNGALYFSARDVEGCWQASLWTSDGTPEGTRRLGVLDDELEKEPGFFTPFNGEVYFSGSDFRIGRELYKTDGEYMRVVKDIRPGLESSSPRELLEMNGSLYFVADDGVTGAELWRSNGVGEDTLPVADLHPGPRGSEPSHLTAVNGVLYFVADDGESGRELWRTEGTAASTRRVRDVRPGSATSSIDLLTPLNGRLYFVADDGETGLELWRSDGTEAGTVRLTDLATGRAGGLASATRLLALPSRSAVLFAADDGTSGTELWMSGELPGQLTRVTDIAPGASGAEPKSLTLSGERVYFLADDTRSSLKLWSLDVAGLPDLRLTCDDS